MMTQVLHTSASIILYTEYLVSGLGFFGLMTVQCEMRLAHCADLQAQLRDLAEDLAWKKARIRSRREPISWAKSVLWMSDVTHW